MKKLLITLTLFAGFAHAGTYMTGRDLLTDMQGKSYETGHALGYVIGVADLGEGRYFCTPGTVSAGQLNDVVMSQLVAQPSTLYKSAAFLVADALRKTYPCKRVKE